jgi:hypothetical protein
LIKTNVSIGLTFSRQYAQQDKGEFKRDALNLSALGKNNAQAVKLMDKVGWQ